MARFNFLGRAVDTYGNVKTSVGITIRLTGTSTPATVYNERTGGTGISTEPQITSDSFGRFNFYIDELDYPYAGNQKFDIIAGGLTYEDIEILRGVKIHSSLEELEDYDHPQYAALIQNEIIDGKWLFSHPVSGQAPTEDNHLTTKYYVQLQSESISAASVEQDKRERQATNVQITSVSAASVEQNKRGHAFTLSASASLYENLNTQIASVSAASVEADKRDRRWASDLFISVSAASIEQDKRDRRWATDLFISVSAASVEQDRTHKIWADTMFASVSAASREQDKRASRADATHIAWAESMFASTSAASVEQDKRERAFTLSASASLYENLNTQIISVSAASVEQDKRDRRWATDLFISTSAASVEADRTHKIWADTMFASVSAASVEQDKRERAFTVSASASLYENLNTQIASVSAASVEQDKRDRRWASDLFISTSAASVEADRTHKIWADTMFASVSAASVEADKRDRSWADATISDLTDRVDINQNKIYEGNSGVVVNDEGTGLITISADGSTIATFKDGKVGINTFNPTEALTVSGNLMLSGHADRWILSDTANVSNQSWISFKGAGSVSTNLAVYGNTASALGVFYAFEGNSWNTNHIKMFHNGTDGYIQTGTGGLIFGPTNGNISMYSDLNIGSSTAATQAFIELGTHSSGNRSAFIDFHGDDTYSDYGLRIIRNNAGANTSSEIKHRGTGAFKILTIEEGQIELGTNNIQRLTIASDGNITQENGLYFATDEVRARDSGGLYIRDDSGTLGIFVEDGGQIGIGIDSPGAKLQLKSSANNTDVFLITQDDDLNLMKLRQSGNAALLDLYDGGTSTIHLDADSDSYFNNSSKFGIGTNSPTSKLEVLGGTLTSSAGSIVDITEFSVNDGNDTRILLQAKRSSEGSNWETDNIYIMKKVDIVNQAYLKFTGYGLALGTGAGSPSDRLTIDENGNVSLMNGTSINEFSIDDTLAGNSDDAVPTEKAVKTYSDSISAASVEQDKRLNETLRDYVDSQAGGGEGFSNKIIEGDSGVTVNDEGTATINISADGDHLAQFKEKEIRLIPGADSTDRIFMGTPADKTGGYFEIGPSASLSPSGGAPLQYNGYFYATKVYNAVWG